MLSLSRNSTADRMSDSCALQASMVFSTRAKESRPRKATWTLLGLRGVTRFTFVTTPSVPSAPMNSCFRS